MNFFYKIHLIKIHKKCKILIAMLQSLKKSYFLKSKENLFNLPNLRKIMVKDFDTNNNKQDDKNNNSLNSIKGEEEKKKKMLIEEAQNKEQLPIGEGHETEVLEENKDK